MVCRDEPHADFQKRKEIGALQKNMSGTKTKKICLVYLYTWSFFERKFKDKCIRVVTNTLSVHSGWHKAKDLLEVVPFSTWLYLLEKQLNPIIKYLVEDTYITAWVSFVSHS